MHKTINSTEFRKMILVGAKQLELNRAKADLSLLSTWNLDEYSTDGKSTVPHDHPLSYWRYMHEKLFSKFDPALGFNDANAHFPEPGSCDAYDSAIEAAGGLDLQLLGIGFNGHIAFNEPMHEDEMPVEEILWADLIVLATPIYAWYCAAPMKNVLDRHYGFNKFYGSAGSSLWAGKKVAILATHGYEGAYATDPFAMGVERLCKHSELEYLGIYSVQDEDNLASFQTQEAVNGAKAFARQLLGR